MQLLYLQVTVHDLNIMKCLEPSNNLDKDFPYVSLKEVCPILLVVCDLLEEVTVVCELDHKAILDKGNVATANVP